MLLKEAVPKDLIWACCEDYEYPQLVSASNPNYGYVVQQSNIGFSLFIYLLSGGTNSELHHYFKSVEEAQYFAISHHKSFMNKFLKENYYIRG